MDEDTPDYTADEFLDWLCWMWATDGERFYPPERTAEKCVESVSEEYGEESAEYHEALQWETGQHARAYSTATMRFKDMNSWGFDPVERAAREHRDLMERSDGKVDPIDWSWWTDE